MTAKGATRHFLNRIVGTGLALLGLAAVAAGLGGCFQGKTPRPGRDKGTQEKKSPQTYLTVAVDNLRQGATATLDEQMELVNAREAVRQLNNYLQSPGVDKPAALDQKGQDRLKKFHLDKGEWEEVDSTVFTPLDAHYLDLCFRLADVARSLDLQGLTALERARLGFGWVVRQISLKERVRWQKDPQTGVRVRAEDDLLPPEMVLQFGHGTARERALVFLALLRQLRVDGCMIACPGGPRGRLVYWIPGVLVRGEQDRKGNKVAAGIYLFDTRLGIPLPGPGGKGIARLDQVVRKPEAIRSLFAGPVGARVVPRQIKGAQVRLAFPLSGLSPRMQFLQGKWWPEVSFPQEQFSADGKVVLWVDSDLQQRRFRQATKAAVGFWSEAKDGNTPTRVARSYWSSSEGGVGDERRQNRTPRQLIPWGSLQSKYPATLHTELYKLLDRSAGQAFQQYCLAPHSFMVRGRFSDATKPLGTGQDFLRRMRESYLAETKTIDQRHHLQARKDKWCQQIQDAQFNVNEAEAEAREDPNLRDKVTEARNKMATLLQNEAALVNLILYEALDEPLGRESAYLLALCAQERAERIQTRLERLLAAEAGKARRDAANAWRSAQSWWTTFLQEYALKEDSFTHRLNKVYVVADQGRRDQARAQMAVGLYEDLALDLSRTISARLLQARARERTGAPGAVRLLEWQERALKEMEKKGVLKTFEDFPHIQRVGAIGHTSADTLFWLRTTLAFQLDRMQKPR